MRGYCEIVLRKYGVFKVSLYEVKMVDILARLFKWHKDKLCQVKFFLLLINLLNFYFFSIFFNVLVTESILFTYCLLNLLSTILQCSGSRYALSSVFENCFTCRSHIVT